MKGDRFMTAIENDVDLIDAKRSLSTLAEFATAKNALDREHAIWRVLHPLLRQCLVQDFFTVTHDTTTVARRKSRGLDADRALRTTVDELSHPKPDVTEIAPIIDGTHKNWRALCGFAVHVDVVAIESPTEDSYGRFELRNPDNDHRVEGLLARSHAGVVVLALGSKSVPVPGLPPNLNGTPGPKTATSEVFAQISAYRTGAA